MEIDLKKPLIFLFVVVCALFFIRSRYNGGDVLKLAHDNKDNFISPSVDYYVGMGYYARSEYEPAINAFNQLLTDYPTGQYTEDGLFRMGDSYENLMRWDGAKAAYQQYLDQFPGGKYKNLVQRRADQIRNR
jgi:outer membrane protein assembly factor BamD (BamD/ComL family)